MFIRTAKCPPVGMQIDGLLLRTPVRRGADAQSITRCCIAPIAPRLLWRSSIPSHRLSGARRNFYQFCAATGLESYGVAYTDSSPGRDCKSVVDGNRDSIVSRLGGSGVDEKRLVLSRGKFPQPGSTVAVKAKVKLRTLDCTRRFLRLARREVGLFEQVLAVPVPSVGVLSHFN